MSKSKNKNTEQKNIFAKNRVIAAVIVMALVIAVTIISLTSLHSQTEAECWQNLRLAAQTADDQLGVFINNTFANLDNMGNLLTDLGAIDGDNVAEEIGRIRIGSMQMETRLYLPDGRAFTSNGILDDVSDSINYTEIMDSLDAEGRYISCVKKDLTDPERIVMEYFVPVMKDGKSVALLSAVMDTKKLQDRITSNAYNGSTRVYCLDTRDGMILLDNDHKQVYPITTMSDRVDKNGKSIQPYLDAAMKRRESSTTVVSDRYGVPALMFCIPSETNENWVIQIVVLESTAFAAETNVRNAITVLTATEIGLFVIFLIWLLFSVRREKSEIIKKGEEKQKVLADNLEESLTFTNYFLSTYNSAYYVNLDDCGCQIYKRPESIEKNYPVIENYYESLKQYIKKDVHPDDRKELTGILSPDSLRKILENAPDYSYFYRDISGGVEKNIRLQVIRGADENHAAFGFADVTHEFEEQQKRLLGAVPISPDILAKESIGMWAFELDEGQPPRMYGDDAMIKLVGLDHQVPPEEMYHAWYDYIDKDSYPLVQNAVDKMMSGEHAEVQYPWHHPDGHTMLVRCGGVRNFEYSKGIRVEGTHQNVTEVLHYDEKEIQRLKQTEVQLQHETLRKEVAGYIIDHADDDPIDLLKEFAERLRVLIGCDQVIYRDLEEVRIMVNSPAIEKTWTVPVDYCNQCPHLDPHHPMYKEGYTEMDNCQEGWQGIPVYKDCPIKSSLTRIVYCDGEAAGYLAIHYVQNYHHFTELERVTLEEFARVLSMSLSRYEAKKRAGETDSVKKMLNMLFSLSNEYDPIIVVEPESGEYDWYMSQADELTVNTSMTLHGDNLYKNIGIDSVSIIHPDDRAQFQAFYTRENMCHIAESGKPQETENRWFLKLEGKYKWKYNKAVRMVDDEGKVYVVVGVIDTTEAKEKEEEQRVKEIQLARKTVLSDYFLESYASAYYVDLKNRQLEVLRALKGFDENLAGQTLPADELLAGYMGRFTHPEDRERVLQNLDIDIVRERLKTEHEINFIYRDISEQAPGTYRCTIIPGDDEDHAAIGFQNITEQIEELENQQNQLAEALSMAESANRAKTTFLNNMSHDIRTPMNAIIGYTGLAASHIDNKEQVQDYLGKIAQSSDHLLSLINDVLDMSRIESGKMNLEENPENLSDIIHTLRDIIQADVRSKQLDFFVDAVDVNDEDIICDKLRLNQVLLNVLSNAIKYTTAGGTVAMRVTEKTVKPNGYASYKFSIKDNGMGMDEEFMKTIFDPFTRVKSSTVSGIQGTGLGMAITKNIVDMMGGHIDITSTPGKGTEVTIDFDFKLQSAPKAPEEIPELKGVRALVADDDSDTCLSISKMVKEIGMSAEWCTSGKEAVIRAGAAYQEGDSFKVFILDWIMPDMNGIETTRRIRKVVGDDTPIIILTAYDWSDIEEEAKEAGVTAFVSKPMFPSDLHRVLNKCLGNIEESVEEKAVEYDFTGKKILLVEDNDLNLEIATEILKEEGFLIDTAEDGDIAVEKMKAAKAGDYDLVLMDVQMPRMDGYDATRQIRSLGTEISKIPILAMTANAFEEDRKLALESGMNEHIAKPINIDRLKATLARFLK